MSVSLYWRPPPTAPDGARLGYQLKWALAKGGYFDSPSSRTEWQSMDATALPFLRGVLAAADEGSDVYLEAEALAGLIQHHGEVEVALR